MTDQRNAAPANRRPGFFGWLAATAFALCGLGYALPGGYLLTLGGSPYYLLAGLVMTATAVLYARASRAALLLYLLLLAATLVWALWEAGFNGWALLPRLDILLALGIFVLLAQFRFRRRSSTAAAVVVTASFALVMAAPLFRTPSGMAQIADEAVDTGALEGEWPMIGNNLGAQRFSRLSQITPANVDGLEEVWRIRLGMMPEGKIGALEATPLMIGDTLYTCGMDGTIFAIDAETGEVRWQFDPEIDPDVFNMAICRGVTYADLGKSAARCARRIIATAYDGRLIALDARTGGKCTDFGEDGQVDLTAGLGDYPRGYYYITSPAVLVRGRLVVGGSVLDGQMVEEPSGVIRAYDAATGELAWAWDMGRPGEAGFPADGESFTPGTPNAWAPLSGDEESGLVFVPLGNPTPDYVTSHRTPEMERFGSALVALDAETGTLRWSYQTTHGDVWDYDNPSAPTVVDFPTGSGSRPAVIQPTKRGEFFVLDRESGEPLVRTEERAVPQDPAPGERLSPTQPFPVGMPSLGGGRLSEADMWGVTPFDQLWCRIKFRQARYDGPVTPIGVDRPTIVYPGYFGGSEWGGVAVDPVRRIMIANVNYFPMYNQLRRRADVDFEPMVVGEEYYDASRTTQQGTPYAAVVTPFVSPLNVPCTEPPYSELAAIDLGTRELLWKRPLGTARDSGPMGHSLGLAIPMGVPSVGGSLATASGLTFIGASQERSFRAFETETGRQLWETRLPAGGHANPMTYRSPRSGRQFVVIAASGHPLMQNGAGDYLIAYALER